MSYPSLPPPARPDQIPRRPRLRADYLPIWLDRGRDTDLILTSETRSLLLEDPAAADLTRLLDGTRTMAEILALPGQRHPGRRLASSARRLARLGVLADGPVGVPTEIAAAWDARRADPDQAEDWSRSGETLLVDVCAPGIADLTAALGVAGLTARRISLADAAEAAGTGSAAVVVVARSVTDSRLAALNAAFLRLGRAWTLVRPHGLVLLLGPHFIPGETGCWECLRQHWSDNEQLENFAVRLAPERGRPERALARLPALTGVLAGLLAAELPVLAVRGRSERITGRMVALDSTDLTITHHELIRLPHCPGCGEHALPSRAGPIRLTDSPPEPSAADAWPASLDRHISGYLGAISRITPIGIPGEAAFCYSAVHPFATAGSLAELRTSMRGLSGGKGQTDAQARQSAIGEAVERYCGLWRADRPVHRSSYQRLAPDTAVRLSDLLLFSDRQYAERDKLNPHLAHFHRIPEPLPDDATVDWTTGWSLTHERIRALPAAYCWYGHPDLASRPFCGADSNGCAAGRTMADAIFRGFCELVERDSVALWWYHRSRVPGVDLDDLADPWIDRVRQICADQLGREVWVLDITSDLGMPSFAAISRNVRRPTEDILVGFAADLDSASAIRRAMAELCQFLPAVEPADRTGTRYGLTDPGAVHWLTTARLAEQPWLAPAAGRPLTRIADRRPDATSAGAQVSQCVGIATRAGLEVIVVDQTRPEIELAVARVIVPGLRHFWRRLGPGRLWEVPARLGRTPLADTEQDMNPYSVFF